MRLEMRSTMINCVETSISPNFKRLCKIISSVWTEEKLIAIIDS
jgi:hypothetical protein